MKQILEIINKYRKNNANIVLFKGVCRTLILFFSIYILNVIIEFFYYLGPEVKIKLVKFYFATLIFSFIYLFLEWIITINSFFNYKSNYDIAKETFSQLFTSKSTGRLMADMARLQRASLTSPIDQGSRDLIESEYSEEFANIKRDLHPHYFLSYKVMGDVELEDQRYDNAVDRYQDAVS